MNKRIVLVSLLLAASVLTAQLKVPYLSGRVNDYAGVLSSQTASALERKLAEHERATSNQVVVLIISSLEGEILEEYSLRVAETWKLGQRDKDNGALLLIARDDRKLRVEVGDGLEGTLTDARCSQIIRNEIVPRFRNNDYDGGVMAGVDAILGTIEGSYVADEPDEADMDFEGRLIMGIVFLLVVGLFTVIAVFIPGFMGWFLYLFLMPFWFAFPLAVIGGLPEGGIPFAVFALLFPLVRLKVQRSAKEGGWQKNWGAAFASTGSGSWSSGGGWSSGGSSFSGGGGSFSGGGSSGSW
jgi:uncharacterized protein